MILSLPDRVADPAVYIISSTLPVEGVIHKRALNLYGGICRLQEDAVKSSLQGDSYQSRAIVIIAGLLL